MEIIRLKNIILAFLFGVILMITFNDALMNYVGLSADSEIRILAKVTWLGICILIGTMIPIGLGKEDTEFI